MSRKVGRPSKYTPELGRRIYNEMSEGKTLLEICKAEDVPDRTTIWEWKDIEKHPEFCELYNQAIINQARAREEMMLARAHDESRDYQPDGKGGLKSDNTAVQRDKLICDSLKWVMSLKSPKEFAPISKQEITGADGASLVPVINVTIKS